MTRLASTVLLSDNGMKAGGFAGTFSDGEAQTQETQYLEDGA